MASHNDLGALGEDMAAGYLVQKKYKVLDRNWRWKKMELDIVARHEDYLVVIEVKTRKFGSLENPKDAVTKRKQRFIIEAANAYLELNKLENEIRLDIISVLMKDDIPIIEHIEDAFFPMVS